MGCTGFNLRCYDPACQAYSPIISHIHVCKYVGCNQFKSTSQLSKTKISGFSTTDRIYVHPWDLKCTYMILINLYGFVLKTDM